MAGQQIATRTPMQVALEHVASDAFVAKIKNALPEKLSPQRFVSVTVTAIKQNPELITVEPDSLYNSIVRCAQDGLMPDGREAALVVYNKKGGGRTAQYMPMIGGYRKIAAKHGYTLVADVVREGDKFAYSKVPPKLVHEPAPLGRDRGDVVGAYAAALYPNGRLVTAPEVMTPDEIEKVRSVSRAAKSEYGPWVNWWDRMAAKTVARRLFSQLPLGDSDEATGRVIAASDAEFDFGGPESMSEDDANIIAAVQIPPPREETKLRDEPDRPRPSDAQLNRIAQLQAEIDPRMWAATLKGIFGVESPEDLDPEDAARYEETLSQYVASAEQKPDGGGDVIEDAEVVEEPASFEDMVPADVKEQQKRGRSA